MEGRWSSVAAAKEDCGESRPPLEEGGSAITAATHGGASTRWRWPLGEPYSYGGTKSPYMLKGLLGNRSNTVEPSHPFLQGPLGESWMYDGTKSSGPLEEPWTHGGIKLPTHIYYIMMNGQRGKIELGVPDRYLGLVQVSGLSNGLGRATRPYFRKKKKKKKKIESSEIMLPEHLIMPHILPRLPINQLFRLKLVCKDWNQFIQADDPHFLSHHFHKDKHHATVTHSLQVQRHVSSSDWLKLLCMLTWRALIGRGDCCCDVKRMGRKLAQDSYEKLGGGGSTDPEEISGYCWGEKMSPCAGPVRIRHVTVAVGEDAHSKWRTNGRQQRTHPLAELNDSEALCT
ncbi:hypothetical protein Scep_017520 [Stephania cephalantha]|uniref:F-box domain-containing protein n=1 Tax=Stephania cephalantha TaxID=152367 RepID=A0AAP0IPR2_9MAGN